MCIEMDEVGTFICLNVNILPVGFANASQLLEIIHSGDPSNTILSLTNTQIIIYFTG